MLQDFVLAMRFNLKDLVIMLELLIVAVMFMTGNVVTFRQPAGVKRTARKVLKGAMLAEFAAVLLWVFAAIQL